MGDGGYQDTFNMLKQQIDYNYKEYKFQLADLEVRKNNLKKEVRDKKILVLALILAPLVFYGFELIFLYLGSKWGFFGIFYFLFLGLTILSVAIGVFFMLPPAARNYLNALYRLKVLCSENGDKDSQTESGQKDIITFEDEKMFLLGKITNIELFYERVKTEKLDRGVDSYRLVEYGEMTDYARQVLEEMREKSVFREYKTTNAPLRKEADGRWLIICLGLLVSLFVIYMVIKTKN